MDKEITVVIGKFNVITKNRRAYPAMSDENIRALCTARPVCIGANKDEPTYVNMSDIAGVVTAVTIENDSQGVQVIHGTIAPTGPRKQMLIDRFNASQKDGTGFNIGPRMLCSYEKREDGLLETKVAGIVAFDVIDCPPGEFPYVPSTKAG